MSDTVTPLQKLVTIELGEDVAQFIRDSLADERSLRWIQRNLEDRTGTRLGVETIRNWSGITDEAKAS